MLILNGSLRLNVLKLFWPIASNSEHSPPHSTKHRSAGKRRSTDTNRKVVKNRRDRAGSYGRCSWCTSKQAQLKPYGTPPTSVCVITLTFTLSIVPVINCKKAIISFIHHSCVVICKRQSDMFLPYCSFYNLKVVNSLEWSDVKLHLSIQITYWTWCTER